MNKHCIQFPLIKRIIVCLTILSLGMESATFRLLTAYRLSRLDLHYEGRLWLEHAQETGHHPIWNEVKFSDRDPHWYTRWVKEVIHIRLHPNNINRDSGIEILKAWMPTIKKHANRKTVQQRIAEGTDTHLNNGRIEMHQSQPNFVIKLLPRKQSP